MAPGGWNETGEFGEIYFSNIFSIGSDLVKYLSLSTHIIFLNVFRGGLVTSSQTLGSLLMLPGWQGQ
jgi:hypothetical protein